MPRRPRRRAAHPRYALESTKLDGICQAAKKIAFTCSLKVDVANTLQEFYAMHFPEGWTLKVLGSNGNYNIVQDNIPDVANVLALARTRMSELITVDRFFIREGSQWRDIQNYRSQLGLKEISG